MKIPSVILILLIPIAAFAQDYRGMNEKDMEKMMQQMQKMQSCMQNVDQGEIKKLEERSRQFEAEIRSLCAGGKREEAQEKAISFGREMAKAPAVETIRKCGKMMEGMMPKMPFAEEDKDYSKHHVCDE